MSTTGRVTATVSDGDAKIQNAAFCASRGKKKNPAKIYKKNKHTKNFCSCFHSIMQAGCRLATFFFFTVLMKAVAEAALQLYIRSKKMS